MAIIYRIRLTVQEREQLMNILRKQRCAAARQAHARLLLKADEDGPEGGLLLPSLRWCRRHLGWWPGIVVADMGYLSASGKQASREGLQTAVVTKLRADMKLVPPYASATTVEFILRPAAWQCHSLRQRWVAEVQHSSNSR